MQIPADRDFSNNHPAQRTRSKSPLKRSIRELSSDIEEGIVPIKKKRGRPKKVKNPDVDEKKKKQEQEVRGRGRKRD
ncbi:hypothetical protein QCA50_017625 [Cerrena zonata]|uniref:Uncharacterized protein n=1 Tax=Cerrena zonata TaxID=2478898 RepID=A0AAW0FRR1_9APHY